MSSVPKYDITSGFIPCDNGNAKKLAYYGIDALLVSQPHWRLKSGAWSGGGEFFKVHDSVRHFNILPIRHIRNNVPYIGNAGGVTPIASATVPAPGPLISAFGKIDDYRESYKSDFATAWARTKPGSPLADLGQFIVELRDFPVLPGYQAFKQILGKTSVPRLNNRNLKRGKRKLSRWEYAKAKNGAYNPGFLRDWLNGPVSQIPYKIQVQLGFFRSLGSEYLNWVFGWAPFVRDLQKLYVLSETIDNRMRQIRRDNNRGIRRHTTVTDTTDTVTSVSVSPTPFVGLLYAPPSWTSGTSTKTVTTVTTVKSWYSARYRYYIPDVNSWGWDKRARASLYGALPTPELIWELTPWSWLIDWFGNVGDVLSNFSTHAVDNLVADYAFLMIHGQVEQTASVYTEWSGLHSTGAFVNDIDAGRNTFITTRTKDFKVRVHGSPYGLGFKATDLSPYQLGVLAALGISKSSF